MTLSEALFSSERDDWETPQDMFEQLHREFNFTVDVASSDHNAKLAKHYTEQNSGLEKSWEGETVFCNPPYGRNIHKWIKKAYEESLKPNTTVVLFIPSRTDTRYFHDYLYGKAELRFLRGRVKLEQGGEPMGRAPFPSLIAVLGDKAKVVD